jgi:hypothetical protein
MAAPGVGRAAFLDVQYAPEKWRILEPEDVGPGCFHPKGGQRKAKTKEYMTECLRLTLR